MDRIVADGRIRSNTQSNLLGAWAFTIVWNLISIPLVFIVPREIEPKPVAGLALLFPLIGLGMLARAVLITLRWRRFGPATFEMAPPPASPGGRVSGAIHTRLASGDARTIRVTLTLTCLQRVITGSGKNRSKRETILWREEYRVPEGQVSVTPSGTSIPVHFPLPADAQQTTTTDQSAGLFWVLTADAELPGVNLNEEFEVPVYQTGETPVDSEPEFARDFLVSPEPVSPADLATSGIHIRRTPEGTEYHFAAARNVSFGFGLTTFTLVWTGAIWLQIVLEFPLLFPIVTGLVDLVLLLIVANLWFGSTTVTIGGGVVKKRYSILGISSTLVLPCPDITKLDLQIGSQTSGRSGTPYYELRATRQNGRRTTLGGGIRNKRHAEWLAGEMRRDIGLNPL